MLGLHLGEGRPELARVDRVDGSNDFYVLDDGLRWTDRDGMPVDTPNVFEDLEWEAIEACQAVDKTAVACHLSTGYPLGRETLWASLRRLHAALGGGELLVTADGGLTMELVASPEDIRSKFVPPRPTWPELHAGWKEVTQ